MALAILIRLKIFRMTRMLILRMFPTGWPPNLPAFWVGLAFSSYEHEVIHLLSKIDNSNVSPKTSVQGTPASEVEGASET